MNVNVYTDQLAQPFYYPKLVDAPLIPHSSEKKLHLFVNVKEMFIYVV